jgi:ribosomal protein S17E
MAVDVELGCVRRAYCKVVFKNLLTWTEENDENRKLISTLTKNQSKYHQNISQKYHCLCNMDNKAKIYFFKPSINDIYTYIV